MQSCGDDVANLDAILLVSGVGGTILNSKPKIWYGVTARVWVCILLADLEFRKRVWSMYNPDDTALWDRCLLAVHAQKNIAMLCDWLYLSLNHSVPSSLLILSRHMLCVESINGVKEGKWKATLSFYSFYRPVIKDSSS
ncbi:hypothetical protein L1887_35761 [Cichorium endivia]|nr:hypothetical protein L1887_35761 [Cichorium endivia]